MGLIAGWLAGPVMKEGGCDLVGDIGAGLLIALLRAVAGARAPA